MRRLPFEQYFAEMWRREPVKIAISTREFHQMIRLRCVNSRIESVSQAPIPGANSIAIKAGSANHPARPVVGRRDP
jgi:hypothetical protein